RFELGQEVSGPPPPLQGGPERDAASELFPAEARSAIDPEKDGVSVHDPLFRSRKGFRREGRGTGRPDGLIGTTDGTGRPREPAAPGATRQPTSRLARLLRAVPPQALHLTNALP